MNCISHSRNVELQEICENDMATPLLMRDKLSVGLDPGNGTPSRRCLLDEMEAIISRDDTQSYSSARKSGISIIGSPMSEQFTKWEDDVAYLCARRMDVFSSPMRQSIGSRGHTASALFSPVGTFKVDIQLNPVDPPSRLGSFQSGSAVTAGCTRRLAAWRGEPNPHSCLDCPPRSSWSGL